MIISLPDSFQEYIRVVSITGEQRQDAWRGVAYCSVLETSGLTKTLGRLLKVETECCRERDCAGKKIVPGNDLEILEDDQPNSADNKIRRAYD